MALRTIAWMLVAIVGLLCLVMGRRVFIDEDWEDGEWWALRRQPLAGDATAQGRRAMEVGFATWLGMMIGTAVKLALVFVMVGAFVAAYLF